jgi:hypothetical protein
VRENAVINLKYFLSEAPLAQLDRASGYEPEGREFESLRAHHSLSITCRESPNLSFGSIGSNIEIKPRFACSQTPILKFLMSV